LAGAVARRLNAGVVPIRKRGALFPGEVASTTTAADYRGRTTDLLLEDGCCPDPIASLSSTIG
jgi:adenine/guanine phosphoribosyltransferase-like PRPP-binding protein